MGRRKARRQPQPLDFGFRSPEEVCEYRATFDGPRVVSRSCLHPSEGAWVCVRWPLPTSGHHDAIVFAFCEVHADDLAEDLASEGWFPVAHFGRSLPSGDWYCHPVLPDSTYVPRGA